MARAVLWTRGREQGARALAEAQVEVDQRAQAQLVERGHMAGFRTAVAGDAGREDLGRDGPGDQRGGARR